MTGAADDSDDRPMPKRKRTPSSQEAPRTDKAAPSPPTFDRPGFKQILLILSATVSLNVQHVIEHIGEGKLTHARTRAPCSPVPRMPSHHAASSSSDP